MAEWEPVMITFIGTSVLTGIYRTPTFKAQSAAQLAELIKEVAIVSKVCVSCAEDYYGPGIRCQDIEPIINTWDSDLQSQIIYMKTSVPADPQAAWMQDITSQIRYSLDDHSMSLVRFKYSNADNDPQIFSINQEIEAVIKNVAESADSDFKWTPTQNLEEVLHGGNFISDGQWLNFSTDYLNSTARMHLGIQASSSYVLDLPALPNTATNHIDTYLRMTDPNTVLISACTPDKFNLRSCMTYEKVRSEFETQVYKSSNGQKINVYTLPLPNANSSLKADGPNYINSVIVNGKVIVPIFNDMINDPIALATYKLAMPDYEVVGVYFKDIMNLHEGGMRCLTKVVGYPFSNKSYGNSKNQRKMYSKYDASGSNIVIFPNPASDYITINDINQDIMLEIYNIFGVKLKSTSGLKRINVSDLETGTYIVKINNGINSITKLLYIK